MEGWMDDNNEEPVAERDVYIPSNNRDSFCLHPRHHTRGDRGAAEVHFISPKMTHTSLVRARLLSTPCQRPALPKPQI